MENSEEINKKLNRVICLVVVASLLNAGLVMLSHYQGVERTDYLFNKFGDQVERDAYQMFQNMTKTNLSQNTTGLYYYKYNVAQIFMKHRTPANIMRTCAHESSHYLQDEMLTARQEEEYEEIYENSDKYISSYATKSWEEDFAETMEEAWACQFIPERIWLPDRRDWIKSNVEGMIN